MLGNWPRPCAVRIAALVALALAACAHNVPQNKATGADGRVKGARTITLEQNEGSTRGIVTYPGGDRVDWKVVELPKQPGLLTAKLSWTAPRPGLRLSMDIFDEWGRKVSGKGPRGRRSRTLRVENARGKHYIRVFAIGRGDAGAYRLKVSYEQTATASKVDWLAMEVPLPPALAGVPAAPKACDPRKWDAENPACENVCPIPRDPSVAACQKVCPEIPDINIPACHATMECPPVPDRRVAKCASKFPPCDPDAIDPNNPKCDNYKAPPVRGKVIDKQVVSDGVKITINRGTDDKVKLKWKGRLIKPNGKPVPGGEFVISNVTNRQATGKVKLTVDAIDATPDVELSSP